MVPEHRKDILCIHAQYFITGCMTVLVIDFLEVIKVHECERQGKSIALNPCHLVFQTPHEGTAVGKTGQFIGQAEQAHPRQFIGQFTTVRLDQLHVMVGTVQFFSQLVMPFHEFFNLTDHGPAGIFDPLHVIRLA